MLQVGDLVRLKSGGPLMTVAGVDGDQIRCIWFGADHTPHRETFPVVLLTKVSSDVRGAVEALSTALQLRGTGQTWHLPNLPNPFRRREASTPSRASTENFAQRASSSAPMTPTPPRTDQERCPGQIDADRAADCAPGQRVLGEDLDQRQQKLVDEACGRDIPGE
jgi:uncharacterized protein YodC (DUF2158 family)